MGQWQSILFCSSALRDGMPPLAPGRLPSLCLLVARRVVVLCLLCLSPRLQLGLAPSLWLAEMWRWPLRIVLALADKWVPRVKRKSSAAQEFSSSSTSSSPSLLPRCQTKGFLDEGPHSAVDAEPVSTVGLLSLSRRGALMIASVLNQYYHSLS